MRIIDLYLEHKLDDNLLQEANLKHLYTKALNETPKMAQRGDTLSNRVRYFGLSKDGTLNFKVASQSEPGHFYYIYIEAPDVLRLGDVLENGDHLNEADFSRLLTMNGFRIHCGCPAWLYWSFQYMATQGNYEIEPETRAPKRNNTLLQGSMCKHLIAVVKNLYENKSIRLAIIKDIENYLRMILGMDYEDYQQMKHARQIQQQNRAVKWKNKPSDYMNDYFARKAKNHSFLDDHDIKKSLKKEMNKFITANPQSNVDDFLRSYFQMTQKAFAEDMKIPEASVEEYFNELGFSDKKEKVIEKREQKSLAKQQVSQPNVSQQSGVKSNILTKDSEQLHESEQVTTEELNKAPCYISTYSKHPETGEIISHKTEFNNISEVFKYIKQCGGFNQFTDYGKIKYFICCEYKGMEYYYVRNSLALGGWCWEDANGTKVKFPYNKRLQEIQRKDELSETEYWKTLKPQIEDDDSDRKGVEMYKEKIKRGEHRPILVNEDGDILDGNHTMTAYQELGIKPPLLYKGTRTDFFNAVPKVKCDAQQAIQYMIDNGQASLIEADSKIDYAYGLSKEELQRRIKKERPGYNTDKQKSVLYHIYNSIMYSNEKKKLLDEINQAEESFSKDKAKKEAWKNLPSDEIIKLGIEDEERAMNSINESEDKSYLTPKDAHEKYQEYLSGHIGNVIEGIDLIIKCCDDNEFIQEEAETLRNIAKEHDKSKYGQEEYMPYLHHFYPTCPEDEQLTEEFELACKHHIANNKHHWDFWIDPSTLKLRDIPDEREYKLYCVERVADWLAMAAQHDEDKSTWYERNKTAMIMPDWAFEFIDDIYNHLPDDYYLNLSYKGTRGKLDEREEI